MDVSYSAPLRRAWDRMKIMLFRPFRFEFWLVMGFSAFLADICHDQGSSAWSYRSRHHWGRSWPGASFNAGDVRDRVLHVLANPAVLLLIAGALVGLAVLALVLAYVSARAKFVFLDNVVNARAEFVAPWSRSGKAARSLFLWTAAFSFTWLVPLAIVGSVLAGTLRDFLAGEWAGWPALGTLLPACALAALAALVITFFMAMTNEFVVPIMYLHDESATAAWGRFWGLLSAHAGDFIAYFIFVLVLALATGIAVLVVGFGTCCVGLVIMALPYLGTVALLPVHVVFRALGPEFLAQYGSEWDVFKTPPAPVDPATAGPPERLVT